VRFVASATPHNVAHAAAQLDALHAGAVARHVALATEVGVPDLVVVRGHLHLYADEAAFARDRAAWRLREQYGFVPKRLDRAGIVALEPGVDARYSAGAFLADHATVRNPFRYVQAIVRSFVERGGEVRRAEVRSIARRDGGWSVDAGSASWPCRAVVVTAGAWSRPLLAAQGLALPLETQRGYHVEFDGEAPVTRTVVLTDRKAFVAPMETGFRVGGTVEIAGLAAPPDWNRARALTDAAHAAFPSMRGRLPSRRWMGHRPCLPDSVPFVAPVPDRPGLFAAVGHGHLGLTDAPATAERIADAIDASGAGSVPLSPAPAAPPSG
jgi:D-amino-acid dehydrogenase